MHVDRVITVLGVITIPVKQSMSVQQGPIPTIRIWQHHGNVINVQRHLPVWAVLEAFSHQLKLVLQDIIVQQVPSLQHNILVLLGLTPTKQISVTSLNVLHVLVDIIVWKHQQHQQMSALEVTGAHLILNMRISIHATLVVIMMRLV
jgi:hypothetical protein